MERYTLARLEKGRSVERVARGSIAWVVPLACVKGMSMRHSSLSCRTESPAFLSQSSGRPLPWGATSAWLQDLGDFCIFRLTSWRESLDENGYSRLLKLRYASYVGNEEKGLILIDLSLDRTITQPAERIAPANRIEIEGVFVCDYLTYPLADQLADKLCAVMEIQPSGWQSSR